MPEHFARIIIMGVTFALMFAFKTANGSEVSPAKRESKIQKITELQQALQLIAEIEALNHGAFHPDREPFHPESALKLDTGDLSLSQHSR